MLLSNMRNLKFTSLIVFHFATQNLSESVILFFNVNVEVNVFRQGVVLRGLRFFLEIFLVLLTYITTMLNNQKFCITLMFVTDITFS